MTRYLNTALCVMQSKNRAPLSIGNLLLVTEWILFFFVIHILLARVVQDRHCGSVL